MKLYAVRDRLVDYYMQPFCATGDKQVLAAVATQVNAEDKNVIAQAPHHFEVWSLGEVDELTGKITPELTLIADCNTLVRGGVWKGEGADRTGTAIGGRTRAPEGAGGSTDPEDGPAQGQTPRGPGAPQAADPGPPRGDR